MCCTFSTHYGGLKKTKRPPHYNNNNNNNNCLYWHFENFNVYISESPIN